MGKKNAPRDMGEGKHSKETRTDGHKKGSRGPFVDPSQNKKGKHGK
ncbi:hypothetical protein [Salininema proteolyticum]|uniref:Uncharacterized protein n=1 Tax=Salininema proteolyticum TaxID=1607685 RepID=A0ABV8TTI2_9ACTN